MVNYQNGKIYKIEDVGGNMCYIGSTTKEHLAQRMAEHQKGFRPWQKTGNGGNYTAFRFFEKYGVENCIIILVILYPCNSKDELTKQEAQYIRNTHCINTVIPDRTAAEYGAMYYQENKEELDKYKMEHRAQNLDAILLRDRNYYHKNKETIKEKKRKLVLCECGSEYVHCSRAHGTNDPKNT